MPGVPIENPVFEFEQQREEDVFSSNTPNAVSLSQKPIENEIIHSKRVFSVRLGKFRSSNIGISEKGEGETSSSNMEARRCYSMGSYQYVVDDLNLQVALCPSRGATNAVSLNIGKGRSGQGGNSSIEGDIEGKKINIRSKGESFSVSKIWQWSKKGKFPSSSENHMGSSPFTVSFPWNDHTQGT
uniref:Uncharacterized protein n=1 Tax=Rhizophora mucronata TaxID=61149 RepID=A0A2P2PRK9_RHIMU